MGQPDIATQCSAVPGVLPFTFPSIGQTSETLPSSFQSGFVSETLKWGELTYLDRTFVFNRELVIRVLKEDGGWAFESDDPELMGFGHTRSEAELTFCLDFAAQWDDLACEEDDKLTQGAKKVKRDLLALVKSLK